MNTKVIGQFVYVQCSCGRHLVDLFDLKWNDPKVDYYQCNDCNRPLVIRADGKFYYVGNEITMGR